ARKPVKGEVPATQHREIPTQLLTFPENPNYLEAFLDFEYKVGLSPFRIERASFVSSLGHKVVNILWIVLASLCTLHQCGLISATVKRRKLNDREYYSEVGFALLTGIMRIVYVFNLWKHKHTCGKLVALLQSQRFAPLFHTPNAFKLATVVRGLSFLASYVVCGLGLNAIPTHVLITKPWDWRTLFLSHEYAFNSAFSSMSRVFTPPTRVFEQAPWPGKWSSSTMPLGMLGIMLDFSSLVLNSCVQDMMLLSALCLLTAGEDGCAGLAVLLDRYVDVSELSRSVNQTIRGSVPSTTVVGIVATAYGVHALLQRDFAPAVGIVLFAAKLLGTFFVALRISRKCKRFEKWLRYRIAREEHNGAAGGSNSSQ
ncbi:hypothetical protein Ocin01_07361, partial [Orchesella cincta]